jgi:hypothetical protein
MQTHAKLRLSLSVGSAGCLTVWLVACLAKSNPYLVGRLSGEAANAEYATGAARLNRVGNNNNGLIILIILPEDISLVMEALPSPQRKSSTALISLCKLCYPIAGHSAAAANDRVAPL